MYHIQNIRQEYVNRRPVKMFEAYKWDKDANAYVFHGVFCAPARTADENLSRFIDR